LKGVQFPQIFYMDFLCSLWKVCFVDSRLYQILIYKHFCVFAIVPIFKHFELSKQVYMIYPDPVF
jgi:hypothetical protein